MIRLRASMAIRTDKLIQQAHRMCNRVHTVARSQELYPPLLRPENFRVNKTEIMQQKIKNDRHQSELMFISFFFINISHKILERRNYN